MKRFFLISLSLSLTFISCLEQRSTVPKTANNLLEIPNQEMNKAKLYYNTQTSLWIWNEQLYSGYAVTFYDNGMLKEKFGILDGKKQNESILWYPDGHYKQVANYHKGKLHGEKKSWSSDSTHTLVSHLNYHLGKGHGVQKKWYRSGEIFKILNLEMGKEAGIQQAFRKNGDLFANYEAREGRIFGLKKSALCFGLDDEKIEYEN